MSGQQGAQSPVPVVMLLEELDFGGTQRQTLELAARLDRTRFAPRLAALHMGNRDLADKAADLGLDCIFLTDRAAFHPALALPALWRFLARERPPLLHLLTALPNIWGRIFGRCLRLPGVIAACRGGAAVSQQHERLLWRLAGLHICNSAAVHERLLRTGVPQERALCIPNGVDTDFFSSAARPSGAPVILCVARMAPEKNHAMLLRAFARVLERLPRAILHLAGEGRVKRELREMASTGTLRGKVHLHAGSTDMRPLYHQAQVAVLASSTESMPNALLEAMACGLPVAATRVGGVPEIVEHEKTGLLVPPGDDEAMAAVLIRLLENETERTRLGRAGRARVLEHFSLRAMVGSHEQAYDLVLRGRNGPHCAAREG